MAVTATNTVSQTELQQSTQRRRLSLLVLWSYVENYFNEAELDANGTSGLHINQVVDVY